MSPNSATASDTTACCVFHVLARDAGSAEIAAAEAFEAGANGLEERAGVRGAECILVIYAPEPDVERVRRAVARGKGVESVGTAERCATVDWSTAWSSGLVPIVVSEELVVRPSCAPIALAPGQGELEIDPGLAFGTGGHESTRLALDLLAALPRALRRGATVLDVGTGSGVLALAALRLGAGRAIGFDLDAVAVGVAQENARRNGLAATVSLFAGSLDAVTARRFDVILANLLKREILPLAPALARHVGPGSQLLLSGLLQEDETEVLARFAPFGLHRCGARVLLDASGTTWLGLALSSGNDPLTR